jgi:multiple sugar transport system ATP-binding protein
VYVTHDQVEAMTMGDRIAIMNTGELQQVGPPQDVYEKPANLFVARFIGNPPMNTITGTIAHEPEGAAVDVPGGRVPLPAPLAHAVTGDSRAVVLGVRPEHLAIGEGPVAATVSVVESLGHERHVVCRLDDGQLVTVRQPSSTTSPADGTSVRLSFDPEQLHLFDATTEARLV